MTTNYDNLLDSALDGIKKLRAVPLISPVSENKALPKLIYPPRLGLTEYTCLVYDRATPVQCRAAYRYNMANNDIIRVIAWDFQLEDGLGFKPLHNFLCQIGVISFGLNFSEKNESDPIPGPFSMRITRELAFQLLDRIPRKPSYNPSEEEMKLKAECIEKGEVDIWGLKSSPRFLSESKEPASIEFLFDRRYITERGDGIRLAHND